MDTLNNNRTIIVGAGASGLMLANLLVERGEEIVLIEKQSQPGLKLRITGKGRCNLTNTCEQKAYLEHINNPEFFLPAFTHFDNKALIAFFEQRGLELVEERGGRVFPKSSKASDVFFNLIKPLEKSILAEIVKDCRVESLIEDGEKIVGVRSSKGDYLGKKVVIATGGCTYPSTGSMGDGYSLAEQAGHRIVRPLPVLVGLRTEEGYGRGLQDFTIKNCELSVSNAQGKVIASLFGDICLDEYGVSGPVVLSLSRIVARELDRGERLYLLIDYKPRISEEKLMEELREVFSKRRVEPTASVLRKWFAAPMVAEVLRSCGLNGRSMAKNLKDKDFQALLWYMKKRRQRIVGDMGWKEAIVTSGGVSLEEVDENNMRSKKKKGLCFVGEVLDLDADTGGYNLQIAFSTAALCADNI